MFHNAADAALRLSRFEESLGLLDQSDAEAEKLGAGRGRSPHNNVLRAFIHALGANAPWRELLAESLQSAEAQGEIWVALEMLLFSGLLEAWRGDRQRARSALSSLEARARKLGHLRLAAEVAMGIEALDRGGKPWFRGGFPPPG